MVTRGDQTAMTDKVTESAPLAPVSVTMIGTGDVSGGPSPLATGVVATTPMANQPNIRLVIITPIVIIAVRAFRVFLQTLLATLTAAATGVMPAGDFFALLMACASISVGASVFCIIQNVIELLARFDQSHPTLAG